jgi:hypothetical protein
MTLRFPLWAFDIRSAAIAMTPRSLEIGRRLLENFEKDFVSEAICVSSLRSLGVMLS